MRKSRTYAGKLRQLFQVIGVLACDIIFKKADVLIACDRGAIDQLNFLSNLE